MTLESRRSTVRDGLANKLDTFALTNFGGFWRIAQKIGFIRKFVNRKLIDRAIYKTKTRPYPYSTWGGGLYTSWDSLTDRTWSGRHLPPKDLGPLPDLDEVADLFMRRKGRERISPKSTVLFQHFAQWFTDGFLRTDRQNQLKNTSNHDIDLSQMYGRLAEHTGCVRAKVGGRLKSQVVNGEEYPPFYYEEDGRTKAEFEQLPLTLPEWELAPSRKVKLFAMGGNRANVTIGYAMLNTLFLREHNRICGLLAGAHPGWDDERLFQTARNTLIVILLKIVIGDYINHITPYHFRFAADAPISGASTWYRQNWMSIEFNLLYRWHGLVTDQSDLGGGVVVSTSETLFHNDLILERGLGAMFEAASKQAAGDIGLFNTPCFLLRTEKASIAQGRLAELATYNDYRAAMKYPRVTDFDQISGDPDVQAGLRRLYGHVDAIEFYVGLFAEDVREGSALSPLIGRMVGIDAFSQALTNPLLAENIFNEKTFSDVGLRLIKETGTLSDVLNRNLPDGSRRYFVSLTREDWLASH